jgi:thiol-disulfide isomerase/thioredoxin
MRRVLALALLLGCAPQPAPVPPRPVPARPVPARPASPFAMIEASVDLDGVRVGSSDAPATIVVVLASWCGHCRAQLATIAELRAAHPAVRVVGVNYKAHEEYDGRGTADAVRNYVRDSAPWLRVVPADEALFGALGRPPRVPTLFIYDRSGSLVETFDRRARPMPDGVELAAVLRRLGA